MITCPAEAREHSMRISKELLALVKYHNKEAQMYIRCGDYKEAEHNQDIVEICIAMMECLETLEDGEES